ncbi:hypothetical protein BH18ACT12_BH18ACT12_13040 [soil metagenome]
MNTVLLTAGVVALMAAVIGGGLKAFNIEIGPLSSRGVRFTLGLLGIVFIVAAVILRDNGGGGSNGAEASYQRQVLATCNAVRKVAARSDLGTPQLGPAGPTFDRDAFVSTGRANLAAIERRLSLLLDKPVPDSLRSEAEVVRDRKTAFVERNREILNQLGRTLPQRFTVEQFNALTRPLQDAADNVLARLEDAMSQLAGQDCALSSS